MPCHEVIIKNLRQCPEHLDVLAEWHQQEWPQRESSPQKLGDGRQGAPMGRRYKHLKSHLDDGALPNTWVALDHDELVGSVSIVDHVFHQDKEPSAWLANLFVVPRMRNKGLGRQLLQYAEDIADSFDLQRLFLFTPDCKDYYQRQHWEFLHQARVQGAWVDVMVKPLNLDLYGLQQNILPQAMEQQTQALKSQSAW